MPEENEWFDRLYLENSSRMVKQAAYLLKNQQIAEELVNETFLILLYKRSQVEHHPNLAAWLNLTLKHLIIDELKSARHRLELPMNHDAEASAEDNYRIPLSDLLPAELTPKEREILILFYENQLSHEQIAKHLKISVFNCRTRLFRAKKHYKELVNSEKKLDEFVIK